MGPLRFAFAGYVEHAMVEVESKPDWMVRVLGATCLVERCEFWGLMQRMSVALRAANRPMGGGENFEFQSAGHLRVLHRS